MNDIKVPKRVSLDQLLDWRNSGDIKLKVLCRASSKSPPVSAHVGTLAELQLCMKEEDNNTLVVLTAENPKDAFAWVDDECFKETSHLVALDCPVSEWITRSSNSAIPDWTAFEVHAKIADCEIIDVRERDEFYGPLKHIREATLITLGNDLEKFLRTKKQSSHDRPLVFVCRSGVRSLRAAIQAREYGIQNVVNMKGGMIAWNDLHLPVEGENK